MNAPMLPSPSGEQQFPRTDGGFDPVYVAISTAVADWLATHPHPEVVPPARRRSTAQWLAWLDAEGFLEDAFKPYGYGSVFP